MLGRDYIKFAGGGIMSELSEKFWKENGWKTLMEMIKFNEEPDSTGAFAFVLRNRTKLSKEAWDKVKDLFEYDEICDEYYTDKTFEVIERLKDSEWKEEAEICKKLASDLLPSLTQGASNVEACEVGCSPRASRSELIHPSGRSRAPHPTPLFKEWATRYSLSGRVFKPNYPPASPCVSPPYRKGSCKQQEDKIRDHSEIHQILPELRKLGFEEVKK